MRPDGSDLTRLTDTGGGESEPTWAAYGTALYAHRGLARPLLVAIDRDGGAPTRVSFRGASADARLPTEIGRYVDDLAKGSVRQTARTARRYYVDHGTYEGLTPVTMETLDPDVMYVGGSNDSASFEEVSIGTDATFTAVACSSTGACFAQQETDNAVTTYSVSFTDGWSADSAAAEGVTRPAWPYD